jgi:hypothetical protein
VGGELAAPLSSVTYGRIFDQIRAHQQTNAVQENKIQAARHGNEHLKSRQPKRTWVSDHIRAHQQANAVSERSHTGESLIKYGRINKQTRSKKTKYNPQDTATSNPKQGNQNAPGCLITYGQIQSNTNQKQGKYRRCK